VEEDWRRIGGGRGGGGLQEDSRRIGGGGLEEDSRRIGGFEEDLRRIGGGLEDDWKTGGALAKGLEEDLRRKRRTGRGL